MRYDAIVLAAGSGSRSGLAFNKILYKIDGKSILEKSLENFINDDDCLNIFVTYKNNDLLEINKIVNNLKKVKLVEGGETRQDSTFKALKNVKSEYVLIHDAARPNFSKSLLNRIKDGLEKEDAIIPVIDVKDTIKVCKDNEVIKTLDRASLRIVQTPQGFKTSIINLAHSKAKKIYTDDAAIVEDLTSTKVKVVEGEISNSKFTYKEDF